MEKSKSILRKTSNKTQKKKYKFPKHYLPDNLSETDKKKQLSNLIKSREDYKKKIYFNRPNIKSFKKQKSNHVANAMKLYSVKNMNPTPELSKKTGCSIKGLKQIINKGKGAYYSSGSRPNQTLFSWGIARLASAITGGPSSKIDYHILETECKSDSIALKMAKK